MLTHARTLKYQGLGSQNAILKMTDLVYPSKIHVMLKEY